MNKIRVIDLLNKIANGEEVPEKIKYNGTKYNLNDITGWYQSIDVIGNVNEWFISKYRLNDEVEIIEEQQDMDIQEIDWEEIGEVLGRMYLQLGKGFEKAVEQLDKNIKDKE